MVSPLFPRAHSVLGVAAALSLVLGTACLPGVPSLPDSGSSSGSPARPARASSNQIRIGKALRADLSGVLTFTAEVQAKGDIQIVPRVTARVQRVLVEMGSRVREGDTLIELERTDLEQQVLQAESALAGAEARLATLKAGPRQEIVATAQANLRAAQARVQSLEAARAANDPAALQKRVDEAREALQQAQTGNQTDTQAISRAENELAAARTRLLQIQNDPARANDRAAQDTARGDVQRLEAAVTTARTPRITTAAVDQARRAVQEAEQSQLMGRVSVNAFDLDQARALVEVAEAQTKLANSPTTPEDIKSAEAAAEQTFALAELARGRLRDATIVAPTAGIVTNVQTLVGGTVAPTAAVMTLIPPELIVTVQADESQAAQLQVGQTANLSVESYPKEAFSGTVKGIAPILDTRTRTVAVRVEVPDPRSKLRPGMLTQMSIQTGQRQSALIVPRESVMRVQSVDATAPIQTVVFTIVDSRLKRQVVVLGASDTRNVEVLQGVAEGVDLVLNPRADLIDGELITAG